MPAVEDVFELIRLRTLAAQKNLAGNVRALRDLRRKIAREKSKI